LIWCWRLFWGGGLKKGGLFGILALGWLGTLLPKNLFFFLGVGFGEKKEDWIGRFKKRKGLLGGL